MRWIRRVVGFTLAVASAALFRCVAHADPAPPATRPAHPFAPAFTALAYYDQSCAKCHGPQGGFYGATLGNDLTDDALIRKCRDMAAGPAQSPLSDAENAVETAYHRSLILRSPYVSLTDAATTAWAGEVTPGATVTLHVAGETIAAAVDAWDWTASVPAGTEPAAVTIDATAGGKTTTLHPADAAYSHTVPLPPPGRRQH